MSLEPDTTTVSAPLLLHTEGISVARRRIEGDTIRVSTATRTVEKLVEEELAHVRVEVEHVAIGRQVDSVPAIRKEGDITVIPVVEEILVVEKRLILKEEVHIRRVRVPDVHREVVTLREQDVVVERIKSGDHRSPPLQLAPIPTHQALKE